MEDVTGRKEEAEEDKREMGLYRQRREREAQVTS